MNTTRISVANMRKGYSAKAYCHTCDDIVNAIVTVFDEGDYVYCPDCQETFWRENEIVKDAPKSRTRYH